MELGMHVIASEPISTVYFIDPSHQPVCLYVIPLSLLGNGSVKLHRGNEKNQQIEEMLDASYSMRPIPHRRKVGD
jgi:hypothetical protein